MGGIVGKRIFEDICIVTFCIVIVLYFVRSIVAEHATKNGKIVTLSK